MTRSAAHGTQKKIPRGLRAGDLACREIESLGNGALDPCKSFRTMLLTGSWSHLVSCYAVYGDLHQTGDGFFFFFFSFFFFWSIQQLFSHHLSLAQKRQNHSLVTSVLLAVTGT